MVGGDTLESALQRRVLAETGNWFTQDSGEPGNTACPDVDVNDP